MPIPQTCAVSARALQERACGNGSSVADRPFPHQRCADWPDRAIGRAACTPQTSGASRDTKVELESPPVAGVDVPYFGSSVRVGVDARGPESARGRVACVDLQLPGTRESAPERSDRATSYPHPAVFRRDVELSDLPSCAGRCRIANEHEARYLVVGPDQKRVTTGFL